MPWIVSDGPFSADLGVASANTWNGEEDAKIRLIAQLSKLEEEPPIFGTLVSLVF